MACFLVPGIEGSVTLLLAKLIGRERAEKLKLKWLNTMLWGGVALLAIEHIWHGEVVPWPPFLTAMANPADTATILHEMATHGILMSVLVTLAWGIMVAIASISPKTVKMKVKT